MPARIAGICGPAAFVTFNVGWIAGGLPQPDAYSFANDDTSDLGAVTASSSWIQNRIGANLTGLLLVAFALGLWRAPSPDVLGRLGAGAMLVVGAGFVLDGFFQLDCRGIDTGCANDSWHSHAHKINSGIIIGVGASAAPLILALAFRRLPAWRDSWLPTLISVPALFLASFVFSPIGNGAGQRAGDVVFFLWIASVSVRLLQKGDLPAASARRQSGGNRYSVVAEPRAASRTPGRFPRPGPERPTPSLALRLVAVLDEARAPQLATRCSRRAVATASRREWTPSVRNIARMWLRTVSVLR